MRNPSRVPVFDRNKKASSRLIEVVDGLLCQGYEGKFVEMRAGLGFGDATDVVPSVPYRSLSGRRSTYHPDFFSPSRNALVEVKSPWTFDGCGKDGRKRSTNLRKWGTAWSSGYDVFVVTFVDDKDDLPRVQRVTGVDDKNYALLEDLEEF